MLTMFYPINKWRELKTRINVRWFHYYNTQNIYICRNNPYRHSENYFLQIYLYRHVQIERRGDRGSGSLEKITKLQNSLGTGTDPVENHQATHQAFKTWVQSQTQNKLQ